MFCITKTAAKRSNMFGPSNFSHIPSYNSFIYLFTNLKAFFSMFPVFNFPPLNDWLSNAAGILPLSALIDFINVATGLHIYELTGISHPLWHWPITPAGAQLLLGSEDVFGGCCLDRGEKTPVLRCLDSRWGDDYPCASPFTVRLATGSCKTVGKIATQAAQESKSPADPSKRKGRPIKLDIVRVTLLRADEIPRIAKTRFFDLIGWISQIISYFRSQNSLKRFIVAYIGWFLWMVAFAISIMSQLYFAATYLVTIVLTGFIIQHTHGHHPRRLLDLRDQLYPRLVVTADNMNSMQWTGYQGGHKLVDSLLNKPLYRAKEVSPNIRLQRYILAALIAGQWGMVVVASAHQDWNALVIAFWIVFCAATSAVIYAPADAVQDWLFVNGVRLDKIEVELSNRRVMLSLLVALNKDRDGQGQDSKGASTNFRTKWIDPILAKSEDRDAWEEGLYMALANKQDPAMPDPEEYFAKKPGQDKKLPYWWSFIEEAIEAYKKIEEIPWHRIDEEKSTPSPENV